MKPEGIKKIIDILSDKGFDTPYYIIDFNHIEKKNNELKKAWKAEFKNIDFAYSYKTNSLKKITSFVRDLGMRAEVVSGLELHWALDDKFKGKDIIFNGPIKKEEELLHALRNDAIICIDSHEEVELIEKINKNGNYKPRVLIRMSHQYKKENYFSRFGFELGNIEPLLNRMRKNCFLFQGFHFHCGSNINDKKKYSNELRKIAPYIKKCSESRNKEDLFIVDIGGGFPIKSIGKEELPLTMNELALEIKGVFEECEIDLDKIKIITEPGRFLVEESGYYVTKVINKKSRNNRNVLTVDGGINHLKSLHSWYHPLIILENLNLNNTGIQYFDVYGSNCFESDILIFNMKAKNIPAYIIFGCAGGYDIPSTNHWIRSNPSIFGLYNNSLFQMRKKENHVELRSNQLISNNESYPINL